VRFGLLKITTGETSGWLPELARTLEDRGFDSFFLPEHSHIPVSRRTVYPGGGDMPEIYKQMIDPFIGLAVAGAVTERLLLGTAVALPNERDVIAMAKTVSTLDVMTGGRLLLGVGAGWNTEELLNHGGDPKRRWSTLRERIRAMQEIWTNDVAEFHGRHVDFEALWQWPKPLQRPWPPILLGGHGPKALQRVVEYGDGWFPLSALEPSSMTDAMRELGKLCNEAGRTRPPVSVLGPRPDVAALEHYREIGVDRCVFWNLPDGRDEFFPALDRITELIQRFA
jgi:probable F420-dependent oxidoreductase